MLSDKEFENIIRESIREEIALLKEGKQTLYIWSEDGGRTYGLYDKLTGSKKVPLVKGNEKTMMQLLLKISNAPKSDLEDEFSETAQGDQYGEITVDMNKLAKLKSMVKESSKKKVAEALNRSDILKVVGKDFPYNYITKGNKLVISADKYNDDGTLGAMDDKDKNRIIKQLKKAGFIAKPNFGGGITATKKTNELEETLKKGDVVKFKNGESIVILGPKGDGYDYQGRGRREKGHHPKGWFDMMIRTGKAVVEGKMTEAKRISTGDAKKFEKALIKNAPDANVTWAKAALHRGEVKLFVNYKSFKQRRALAAAGKKLGLTYDNDGRVSNRPGLDHKRGDRMVGGKGVLGIQNNWMTFVKEGVMNEATVTLQDLKLNMLQKQKFAKLLKKNNIKIAKVKTNSGGHKEITYTAPTERDLLSLFKAAGGYYPDGGANWIEESVNEAFKPGDMWSDDFDYAGMLKFGSKVKINTPLRVLEALYDSFEDVNYHSENAHLGDAISSLLAKKPNEAKKHMNVFNKACLNTLKSIK